MPAHKIPYKIDFQGLPVSIETDKGEYRCWKDPYTGEEGMSFAHFPYGYIRTTEGVDGDHVDCYIGHYPNCRRVFIVHQNNPETGKFDEDKVMLGFNTPADAKGAYLHQYDNPKFFGSMDEYDIDEFKTMLQEKKGMKLKKSQRRLTMNKRVKGAALYKVPVLSATELKKSMDKSRKKLVMFTKAKEAPVGTIAVHGGKKMKKTAEGWKPVSEGTSEKYKGITVRKVRATNKKTGVKTTMYAAFRGEGESREALGVFATEKEAFDSALAKKEG
jgi:hypothetical protein